MKRFSAHAGFTLVEIIVATALFVLTVSLIMGLFTYTLKTNRKVQSIRTAVQGTRNFVETLTREVRNGRVFYKTTADATTTTLPADNNGSRGCRNAVLSNYNSNSIKNNAVVLTTSSGETLCFYMLENAQNNSKGELYIRKYNNEGSRNERITSDNFWVNPASFRLDISPSAPPSANNGSTQPRITIFAEFISQMSVGGDRITIPYQTTISTDVYDIPPKSK